MKISSLAVSGLRVKSGIKAGGLGTQNHNTSAVSGLRVKSGIKAGGLAASNHNISAVAA
jgi:hypothetical protein